MIQSPLNTATLGNKSSTHKPLSDISDSNYNTGFHSVTVEYAIFPMKLPFWIFEIIYAQVKYFNVLPILLQKDVTLYTLMCLWGVYRKYQFQVCLWNSVPHANAIDPVCAMSKF